MHRFFDIRDPRLRLRADAAFDVLVIGAGINGSSAAQHLAAAGYKVLLVDKGDFGSGTSSRSSRLLHCGIRHMVPQHSLWEFVLKPRKGLAALGAAKTAMSLRAQTVQTASNRLRRLKWCYPIYRSGQYQPWQFDAGFHLLGLANPTDVPLNYRRLTRSEAARTPLLNWQHDPDRLIGAAMVDEYQYDWPERIVVDSALHAERMGAVISNYTAVQSLSPAADKTWVASLEDTLEPGDQFKVRACAIVNTAGIWIDRVNALANPDTPRLVHGTKGIHIAFRLPPECADYAVVNEMPFGEPLFCAPFGELHYAGPTDVNYEGNLDDVTANDDEIDALIDGTNRALPGMHLRRADVSFAWAGVRPLTYSGATHPRGNRMRCLHDLSDAGMNNAVALTAGAIQTHRPTGRHIVDFISKHIDPSGTVQPLSYDTASLSVFRGNEALSDTPTIARTALQHAATHEHVRTLVDLLFRRIQAGWQEGMGVDVCRTAAEAVADILGWNDSRIETEVANYKEYVRHFHNARPHAAYADPSGAA